MPGPFSSRALNKVPVRRKVQELEACPGTGQLRKGQAWEAEITRADMSLSYERNEGSW